jgi:hypothetical protein
MISMSNFLSVRVAAFFAAWGLGALAVGAAHADAVPSADRPVGEVTMSVGPVVRTSAQGLPEVVRRGSPIMPGDRLDTADGGHLHIKFIDGALVSIRPGSRLWVQDYRYDPEHVTRSLVRFKLEYGVARAISGAAAEGARERFRLNTPLVAIGVRGTDFVVRSGEHATTAAVNQGAIIMAPFGEGCQATTLGPCGSSSARILSAEMGQLLVEFRAQFAQPEIKPLQGGVFVASSAEGPSAHAVTPLGRAPGATVMGRSEPEGLPTTALAEGAVQAALGGRAVTTPPTVTVPPTPTLPAPPPDIPVTLPTLPELPPVLPVMASDLKWGRWAAAAAGSDFSVSRGEAGEGRSVTVGNSDYVLYRIENASGTLASGLGAYQFNLDRGFAQYNLAGQLSPAAVEQGKLSIDFAAARFATDLRVTNALTGAVNISGSGFVRSDGIFHDRTVDGQAIAGATALDGKSAGYFFEKSVGAGTLSGITLWSRP